MNRQAPMPLLTYQPIATSGISCRRVSECVPAPRLTYFTHRDALAAPDAEEDEEFVQLRSCVGRDAVWADRLCSAWVEEESCRCAFPQFCRQRERVRPPPTRPPGELLAWVETHCTVTCPDLDSSLDTIQPAPQSANQKESHT
jgi:hypothetical protein